MKMGYTASELLEIAQQMERNGCAFYDRAAELAEGGAAAVLLELAEMERTHERTFAAMAAELPEGERQAPAYDPNGEAAQYIRAVAGGHVFNLKADPVEWLAAGRTMPQILRRAIALEKDTIVYYLGLRDVVPADLGKERVDDIIREEMSHVVLLSEQLTEAEAR